MAVHKLEDYLESVKAGTIAPVTLVHGDETLLLDECVDAVVTTSVDPAMREFNLDIVDGAKADVRDVLAKATSFPMMSPMRVVVVKTFERLVTNDKSRETFAAYVSRPMDTTRLVLVTENPDFRKRPFTDLKKFADVVECRGPFESQIPAWIVGRAKIFKRTITLDAARMLQAYVGDSLMGIHRELEKISTFVGDRVELTEEDVTAVAGASRGFTVFDLQNSIGRRDYRSAATILRKMMESGESMQGTIVMLTRFFTQLWKLRELKQQRKTEAEISAELSMSPFRMRALSTCLTQFTVPEIEDAFSALRTADSRIKSGADQTSEMELLVHHIVRSRALAMAPPKEVHADVE